MDTYENTIAANDYIGIAPERAINSNYNNKKSFLIVFVLIEMISLIIAALV